MKISSAFVQIMNLLNSRSARLVAVVLGIALASDKPGRHSALQHAGAALNSIVTIPACNQPHALA